MPLPIQTDSNGQTDTTGEWIFIEGNPTKCWVRSHAVDIEHPVILLESNEYILFDLITPKVIGTYPTLKEAQVADRMLSLHKGPKP